MKCLTGLALAALLTGAGGVFAGEGGSAKIEVRGLHVVKPGSPDTGTALDLAIVLPGKMIIDIDRNASKLTSFTDDKQTDLSRDSKNWIRESKTEGGPPKVGRPLLLKAWVVPDVPVAGATKVRLKATVMLRVGSDEKTAEQKNVVLKKGTKVKVGSVELSLDEGSSSVRLDHEGTVASVVFLDKGGKEIKHEPTGWGSSSDGVKRNYETFYSLEGRATEFSVRVTYFTKVESVPVPIDVNVGVGF